MLFSKPIYASFMAHYILIYFAPYYNEEIVVMVIIILHYFLKNLPLFFYPLMRFYGFQIVRHRLIILNRHNQILILMLNQSNSEFLDEFPAKY